MTYDSYLTKPGDRFIYYWDDGEKEIKERFSAIVEFESQDEFSSKIYIKPIKVFIDTLDEQNDDKKDTVTEPTDLYSAESELERRELISKIF